MRFISIKNHKHGFDNNPSFSLIDPSKMELGKRDTTEWKTNENKCNCRDTTNCHVDGSCMAANVVYRARIKSDQNFEKVYIGSTKGTFTKTFYNLKTSFNLAKYKNSVCRANYMWEIKEKESKILFAHLLTEGQDDSPVTRLILFLFCFCCFFVFWGFFFALPCII